MRATAPRVSARVFLVAALAAPVLWAPSGPLAAGAKGAVSGLPVPRYVSLKSDRVNLREGPSKEHRTSWIFQRAGLPVEIVAEFDNWRRIRDAEGSEGWVLHSLLSGRRTAIVAPWRKGETHELRDAADAKSPVVARLESGVVVSVKRCDKQVCRVTGKGYDGFLDQKLLWGVYSDEKID